MTSYQPSQQPFTLLSSMLMLFKKPWHDMLDHFSGSIWQYSALPYPSFDGIWHPHTRHYMLACTLLVVLLIIILPRSRALQNQGNKSLPGGVSVSALHALQKFMVPTRSVWPSYYMERPFWTSSDAKRLKLPIRRIFADVIHAKLELRCLDRYLSLAIKDQLRLNEWILGFSVDFRDRAKVASWAIAEELAQDSDINFSDKPFSKDSISLAESSLLFNFCLAHCAEIPSLLIHGTDYHQSLDSRWQHRYIGGDATISDPVRGVRIWPFLDYMSHHSTARFIESLKGNAVGNSMHQHILSFTTFEGKSMVFDKNYILASLLFMRKSPSKAKSIRSSAPLRYRLHLILGLLTSGCNALKILVAQNASVEYARELNEYAERLEFDVKEGSAFIQAFGVQAWRTERLYARWEAALLNANILSRWIILVEPQNKELHRDDF